MPKMKTKKSAAKRFKITASGKVKYKKAGLRHNLGKRKSPKRKLHLRKAAIVHPSIAGHAKVCLPYEA